MAKPVSVPNSFATSTSAIPLSYLDQNFNALANSTNDLATYSNYVADTGAANAYIANFPTNTNTSSLTAGLRMQFKATNANTGASTLNVQVNSVSIGSGSIVLTDGSALSANSIVASNNSGLYTFALIISGIYCCTLTDIPHSGMSCSFPTSIA